MALTITHTKVSAITDDPSHPEEVRPSDWNANHTITGSVAASEVASGAALSVANDTNVTLTLSGSPTTSLLTAATITAGFTGTLSPARGGMGVANNAASTLTISGSFGTTFTVSGATALTLPTSGTVATTSNKLSAFAATSSSELAGVISDETGSGALTFATSPTLVTPVLGVATATSINKVAVTAPATSATLAIGDGFTLTYDEGSWTPVLSGATTPGTQTYTAQVGRYIRVGNAVMVWCRIALSALDGASAGAAQITGLPFTSSTITGLNFPGFVGPAALITHQAGYNQFVAQVAGGATAIVLQEIGDNIVNSSVPITNFHNTSTIQVMIQYRTG